MHKENTNTESNTITPTILTEKVKKFKLIARESLRAQLISPRLAQIGKYESTIENIKKQIESTDHEIKVETYEISKLDTDHPNYNKKKEKKENQIKNLEEHNKLDNEEIVNIEKEIKKEYEGITKIEKGETKVSQSCLDELVSEMIRKDSIAEATA